MHVKDLLDDLGIRIKLPQHWYSTDISNDFEEPELIENGEIIKIQAEGEKNTKVIVIKYLNNKDDFEYIGKPSELYY